MHRILQFALALTSTVITGIRIDGDAIVVSVRPHRRRQLRCPKCNRACEFYDAKSKPRRWRAMDLARSKCYLEYGIARARCKEHGVLTEAVLWARHKSRYTRDLRAVFQASDAEEAALLLDEWLARASRCRIPQVVAVNKKVRRRRDDIIAAVDLGISNARVEAINNKIKVTVKMGYGFRNTDNLVSLLMLRCSDNNPQLPGRSQPAKEKKAKIRKAA